MVKSLAWGWAQHLAPTALNAKAILLAREAKAASIVMRAKGIVSSCLAAVLAISLVPSAALATETTDTATAAAERAVSGIPTINVTVPTSFILGGDEGIDIQDLGEIKDTAVFINNSNAPVRIKEISYSAKGLNSYFGINDTVTKAKITLQGQDIEWVPDSTERQSIFNANSDSSAEPLILGIGSTDEQKTHECTLSLNMTDMQIKDALIDATKSKSTLRNFMQIDWTFGSEMGAGAETDDFYLKIKDDATNEALARYAGFTYSLYEVSMMADDIAVKGERSTYYPMFDAMVTDITKTANVDGSDKAAGQYECKVKWDGVSYDVRVIGINHDDLATPVNGRTKAGLTFEFVNLLNAPEPWNSSAINVGGWGQSQLRANMNPDTLPNAGAIVNGSDTDSIWNLVPSEQREAFKTVKKLYQPNCNNKTDTQEQLLTIDDKLFITSLGEHFAEYNAGGRNWSQVLSWLCHEGYPYEYWANKLGPTWGANNSLLSGYQSSPATASNYWMRTVRPLYSTEILAGIAGSRDINNGPQAHASIGVRPCFCL